MRYFDLSDFTKGWFVGNFEPTVIQSKDFEVAVKSYKAGESEEAHFHHVAIELTVIVSGRVRMMEREWTAGSIIVIEPDEITDFHVIEDSVIVVVKIPSACGDKFPAVPIE